MRVMDLGHSHPNAFDREFSDRVCSRLIDCVPLTDDSSPDTADVRELAERFVP